MSGLRLRSRPVLPSAGITSSIAPILPTTAPAAAARTGISVGSAPSAAFAEPPCRWAETSVVKRRPGNSPPAQRRGLRRSAKLSAHVRQGPQAQTADRRLADQLRAPQYFRRRGDGRQRSGPRARRQGARALRRRDPRAAVVKWNEDGLVGFAFTAPVILDRSGRKRN